MVLLGFLPHGIREFGVRKIGRVQCREALVERGVARYQIVFDLT